MGHGLLAAPIPPQNLLHSRFAYLTEKSPEETQGLSIVIIFEVRTKNPFRPFRRRALPARPSSGAR